MEVPSTVLWTSPSLVLLGFLALIAVVVMLGRSSTARFEGARYEGGPYAFAANRAVVRESVSVAAATSAGSTVAPSADAPADAAPRPLPAAAAGHPAGRSRPAARTATW